MVDHAARRPAPARTPQPQGGDASGSGERGRPLPRSSGRGVVGEPHTIRCPRRRPETRPPGRTAPRQVCPEGSSMMVPLGGPPSLHPFVRAPAGTAPEAQKPRVHNRLWRHPQPEGKVVHEGSRQLRRLVQEAVWPQEEVGVRSGLPKPGSRASTPSMPGVTGAAVNRGPVPVRRAVERAKRSDHEHPRGARRVARPAPRVDRPQADGEERGRGRGESLDGAADGQGRAREAFAAPAGGLPRPGG
jgi:hypothetical protein